MNYFKFIANDVRKHLKKMGVKKLEEYNWTNKIS